MRSRWGAKRALALLATLACALTVATQLAHGQEAQDAAPAADATDATARIERQLTELGDAGESVTDISPPPPVTAKGWLVYDAGGEEPIAAHDATTPRPIASLAKLMTALVVTEHAQLDDTVTVPQSVNELSADAARMDIRPGEKWKVEDLLRGMLVYSANDAAVALASHVSDGDESAFVQLMNDKAEELGMTDTEFASPTGFDPPGKANTSTPIDYVLLAEAALADETIASAVAQDELTLQRPGGGTPIKLANRNPLLGSYPGVDGVKTGFTDDAGYMLVVHQLDEQTGGELLVLTFASSSEQTRVSDSKALLDWARTLRVQTRIVEGGTPYGSIPVQRSDERVEVFACDDLEVTARVGQEVTQEVVLPRSIAAPVHLGDEVGEVRARIGTPVQDDAARLPETVSLCSGTEIKRRTRAQRLMDYAGDYRTAWKRGVDEVEDAWSSLAGAA
jgi:D-alanyl-D-alanine carboxypeptidase (penicillin-binding protein 5/6)